METSKTFKTSSFYNASKARREGTWVKKLAKCEEQAKKFKKHPIRTQRKLRVDDPLPVFKVFPRQQLAFDFVKSCSEDVHVFAEELGDDGKRQYIVSTLDEFWNTYRSIQAEDRHYYEVIEEGAACRLYFDLEFKREFNQDLNGPEMVEIFIEYVCSNLKESFGIDCRRKHILDLDSSTDTKFSRHLIFHMPGAVFKDNIHAGNFVHQICSELHETFRFILSPNTDESDLPSKTPRLDDKSSPSQNIVQPSVDKRFVKLFVKNDQGEESIFCDQGVYTRNRNFRLFKSSKYGKKATLGIAKENTFKVKFRNRRGSFCKELDYLLFLDSLVSNVSLQENGRDVKVITCDISDSRRKRKSAIGRSSQCSQSEDAMTGYELSPYPSIDEFVRTVIDRDGVQGHIRKWVYFPQGKLLMFDIGGNKWCENIGRQHKSNHIMIVADLRHGVYYQKCYDPDCKRIDYRSQERAIPEELCPFQRDITDLEKSIEKELDEDDSDLCEIADLTEREARHSEHAHEQEKQTLDPTLFEDEEDWEPWKDLPACSATSE
ncbi:DNA-directed primase/polymerase protein isoform X2 [Nematostella vectensis]|uniref:DNA-directed primase/polymerase protein isoform X2 n=1 Tax=Nematostella vectensis TaxID=45351 RepID=UPI00207751C2|nr:DNA-directed primase/polymerase protein isoform X2 [Nematostella vectensis]XP_048585082.1 DNA-directed primase/polymerase protein isoform X2 [Nematostella vectensis]XP_048585083.1 DNA-directed primase/polymerase protein isoform X2 [Nematostella vectensis]